MLQVIIAQSSEARVCGCLHFLIDTLFSTKYPLGTVSSTFGQCVINKSNFGISPLYYPESLLDRQTTCITNIFLETIRMTIKICRYLEWSGTGRLFRPLVSQNSRHMKEIFFCFYRGNWFQPYFETINCLRIHWQHRHAVHRRTMNDTNNYRPYTKSERK